MGNDVSKQPPASPNSVHRGWRSLADVSSTPLRLWRSMSIRPAKSSANSPSVNDSPPVADDGPRTDGLLRVSNTNSILRNVSRTSSSEDEATHRKAATSSLSGTPRVTFDLPSTSASLAEDKCQALSFNGCEVERLRSVSCVSKVSIDPEEEPPIIESIRLDADDEPLSPTDTLANHHQVHRLSPPQVPLRQNHSAGELHDRRQSQLAIRRVSNAQLATKMSTKHKASKKPALSHAQITLIRNTWSQLSATKGSQFLGNCVLQRLFFKTPAVKDTYLKCKLTGSITNHDILLKEHGKLVAKMVDQIVKSLEDMESCSPMLEEIGRQHSKLAGFVPKFWNTFAEAFIDCTIEWGEKSKRVEDSRMAWALIVSFMVDKIKQGHYAARRNSVVGTT